jgi:hypothetical protein
VPGGDHLGGQIQQRDQVGDPDALLGAERDLAALQVDIRLGDEPEQQQHGGDHQDLIGIPQPTKQAHSRGEEPPHRTIPFSSTTTTPTATVL